MKHKLLAALISICLPAGVWAQEYEWLAKAEAEKQINLAGMGTDSAGNIYIAGRHEQNVRFYNADQSSFVLHKPAGSNSNYGVYKFVGKYNSRGSLEWLQSIYGEGSFLEFMCTDKQGNTYLSGAIGGWGTIFTSSDGKNDTIRPRHDYQGFVAKYSSKGELKWLSINKRYGVSTFRKITLDRNGNIYAMEKSGINNQGLYLWVLDTAGKELYYDHWTGLQVDVAEVNAKGEIYAVLNYWDETKPVLIDSIAYKNWKPKSRILVKYVHGRRLETIHSIWYAEAPYSCYDFRTTLRYINHIAFDRNNRPVYSTIADFEGWKTVILGGKEFHREKGNIFAELTADGKIKWMHQSPATMYYNRALTYLPDGRWIWISPVSADPAVQVPVKRNKYGSQWVQELSYNLLDKKGQFLWSVRGGGTADNFHQSFMIPYGKDKFVVSSDIIEYAVLKGSTIKGEGGAQTCMYIGVIGEKLKPVDKPQEQADTVLTDTVPVVAAREADKPAAEQAALNEAPRERLADTGNSSVLPERKIEFAVYPNPTQGVFKLLVTSDAETRIDVLVTDANGKEIYNTKHKVQPGQNQVEFDLGSQSAGYYYVRVLENGMPFCTKVLKE